MYSKRVEAALSLVAVRHADQVRRATGIPYWTHLVHVALILEAHGEGEDAVVTALLHDALEDTCDTDAEVEALEAEIRRRFGPTVAEAVRQASERKRGPEGTALPWRTRKEAFLVRLPGASSLALAVVAADKIHNLRTLLEALDAEGPGVWRRFHAGPTDCLWYHREVARIVETRRPGPLAEDLGTVVAELAAAVAGS